VILVYGHDVGVAGDRPERAKRTVGLEMHRGLVAHALEVRLPPPLTVEKGVAEVDVGEFDILDRRNGGFDEQLLTVRSGHYTPRLVV